jgi:hypothetical protein
MRLLARVVAIPGADGGCIGGVPGGPLNSGPVFNAIGFSGCAAIVVGVRLHRPATRWAAGAAQASKPRPGLGKPS